MTIDPQVRYKIGGTIYFQNFVNNEKRERDTHNWRSAERLGLTSEAYQALRHRRRHCNRLTN